MRFPVLERLLIFAAGGYAATETFGRTAYVNVSLSRWWYLADAVVFAVTFVIIVSALRYVRRELEAANPKV